MCPDCRFAFSPRKARTFSYRVPFSDRVCVIFEGREIMLAIVHARNRDAQLHVSRGKNTESIGCFRSKATLVLFGLFLNWCGRHCSRKMPSGDKQFLVHFC